MSSEQRPTQLTVNVDTELCSTAAATAVAVAAVYTKYSASEWVAKWSLIVLAARSKMKKEKERRNGWPTRWKTAVLTTTKLREMKNAVRCQVKRGRCEEKRKNGAGNHRCLLALSLSQAGRVI